MILRAKTLELFAGKDLTEAQEKNSESNRRECEEQIQVCESYPRRIVLELTNACNMNCIMCGRNDVKFTPTFFDVSWIDKLSEVLPRVEEVTLMGWGEPTLHPQFVEILEKLSAYPNLRKYFCTNGMKLAELMPAIFANKVDIIAISLDGAHAAMNDRIRRGSDFSFICDTLRKITAYKREHGLAYPYMNFVLTAMKSNLHEIPDMVRLAAEIGLEEVKIVYLTAFGDNMLDEVLYDCQDEVRQVFDEAVRLGDELGVKLKLPYIQGEDIAGNQAHKDCYVAWRDFFFGSDGYVRPCMSTPIKFFKMQEFKDFKEIWNAEEYQKFRSCINDENQMNSACHRCYQSSYTNWNKKESFIQIGEEFAPEWEK